MTEKSLPERRKWGKLMLGSDLRDSVIEFLSSALFCRSQMSGGGESDVCRWGVGCLTVGSLMSDSGGSDV